MKWVWHLFKYTVSFLLLIGLVFSSGVFSVLLYGKITGRQWAISYPTEETVAFAEKGPEPEASVQPSVLPKPVKVKRESVLLKAPGIRQFPELPSGCEVVSLTMLVQYTGVNKGKMELASEMKHDPTKMKKGADGSIVYWGNPNIGFVGDVYGKNRGFGIYHAGLLDLLVKYIPTGVDLTGKPFDQLEQYISDGHPVLAWTTIDFKPPTEWVVWDSPLGPIQTTFSEHAVLLVGYDKNNVYVNDPWTGKTQMKVSKSQFVASWKAMGQQALTYD